ncbi:MAG: A/G-specific adenine glycosylase [Candidatus Paceibacterota bacterium]
MRKERKSAFIRKIKNFYKENKREFAWRNTVDPYRILVSEVMLQQTQVSRVKDKYKSFLKKFPTVKKLAAAKQGEVLKEWQGLGYNRRGLFLHRSAKEIVEKFNGKVPKESEALQSLPGIGKNTVGSIQAFAFNIPSVFIETNIRRVFIHEFFKNKSNIEDAKIFPLIEETLDGKNPREWYFALMDYGAHLPKIVKNPNRKSRHYTKQSKFEGSMRQLRARILKDILKKSRKKQEFIKEINDERAKEAISSLVREGFIKEQKGILKAI